MVLEILLLGFFCFLLLSQFVLSFYAAVMGRLGFEFFKYNFPFLKRRGAHYLILLKDGRFKWVYKKFQAVWEWSDGSKTYINKKFDRVSQSAEPLIFLIEGFPTNVKLFDLMPKAELSKFVNNINKVSYTTGRLAETDEQEKKGFGNILPIVTVILLLITVLLVAAVFMNLADLTSVLEQVRPYVPQAIEALNQSGARQLGG